MDFKRLNQKTANVGMQGNEDTQALWLSCIDFGCISHKVSGSDARVQILLASRSWIT
jgi:hypothetical protein